MLGCCCARRKAGGLRLQTLLGMLILANCGNFSDVDFVEFLSRALPHDGFASQTSEYVGTATTAGNKRVRQVFETVSVMRQPWGHRGEGYRVR